MSQPCLGDANSGLSITFELLLFWLRWCLPVLMIKLCSSLGMYSMILAFLTIFRYELQMRSLVVTSLFSSRGLVLLLQYLLSLLYFFYCRKQFLYLWLSIKIIRFNKHCPFAVHSSSNQCIWPGAIYPQVECSLVAINTRLAVFDCVSFMFMQQHISRIVQSVVALVLLVLTVTNWTHNKIGQNIINLETVCMWAIGLEHLTLAYRWFINKQNYEYELSLLLTVFFIIAKLFEKYHPTEQRVQFNFICEYSVGVLLALNIAFLAFVMIVFVLYALRQIYRLMTQTLLSTNTHLQPSQLNQILGMKKPYVLIEEEYQQVSKTCSICLNQFEPQVLAIMLPGCEHCFHHECIQKWLLAKSTCPYCRNNIRLNLI